MLRRTPRLIVASLLVTACGGNPVPEYTGNSSRVGWNCTRDCFKAAGGSFSAGGTSSTQSNFDAGGVAATGGTNIGGSTGTGSEAVSDAASPAHRPNVIVILTDDQGYADVGCFGAQGFTTPNLDRMAAEGIQFTNFYSAAPVCTPSRAALMTGSYPVRVGLPDVLGPGSSIGINSEETTIADLLKSIGYATAAVGKWHLGDAREFLPTRHGFDEYFGLPYSNDMTNPPLPLLQDEEVIEVSPDVSLLTKRYTERAVDFITRNHDGPFFLYLAHTMPHVPIAASADFIGRTERGIYGDVITEIDWSVGQILSTLDSFGIADNTLITYASDNGPWLIYGDHAGSAQPLREGKATTFDGGMRVPGIMRWPGRIKARTISTEVATTMDLLPTIAEITGSELPSHPIDGVSILPILEGWPGAASPHGALYYYNSTELQAVRSGQWKVHLPHGYTTIIEPGAGGGQGTSEWKNIGLSLFNIGVDPTERVDLSAQYPDLTNQLARAAADFDAQLKSNQRPAGHI